MFKKSWNCLVKKAFFSVNIISFKAYKTSIGMFYTRLRVLHKSKSFKLLPSSTSRVKRKWEVFFRVFWYIFLAIICLNLHFAVVNFLNLTLEGVPGPSRFGFSLDYSKSVGSDSSEGLRNFALKKSIQSSRHQGYLKYREATGMQCTSNAYFSIAYFVIRPGHIESWVLLRRAKPHILPCRKQKTIRSRSFQSDR